MASHLAQLSVLSIWGLLEPRVINLVVSYAITLKPYLVAVNLI